MEPVARHAHVPDASFDGGALDCGSGLLLLIRKHLDPLPGGRLLEVRSTEVSVDEDLPAWCRLTGNELVSWVRDGRTRSFLVRKALLAAPRGERPSDVPGPLASPAPRAATIPALATLGVGSWPRPGWLLRALRDRVEGRLSEAEFQAAADDAVRLAVAAQQRAGVTVVTDGEQRRDAYASFVASLLDGAQLVPLTDLLPHVDDPAAFQDELRALDVPAQLVRHPAVTGPLERNRPLAARELAFLKTLTAGPVKIALPGPYLLTRTMFMDCIPDRAYATREQLAADVVRILREEVESLLAAGAALVQLDEPVLTEVVFGRSTGSRSFMCGALGEKKDPASELAFARDLLNAVTSTSSRERVALHVCRGNWTKDEAKALTGGYEPLMGYLRSVNVGAYLLELSTPRAGELAALKSLPDDRRVGVGVVNPKHDGVETEEEVRARIERAVNALGRERLLLHPDCGFATFAESPVSVAEVAEAKLAVLERAARPMREG